jgi:hypothetical protein
MKVHFAPIKDGPGHRPGPNSIVYQGVFFALKNRRPTKVMTPEDLSKEMHALVDKKLEAI